MNTSMTRAVERPFYLPVGDEEIIFKAAHAARIPVLLKGPTGCGKTRFVEAMAYDLGLPLTTVACHEDLSAADLIGRFLLKGSETVWQDGPLTHSVRSGGICYLDEVVEARADTLVVLHPLADYRRILPIDKLDTELVPDPNFMLVASYNPGYQSLLKDLKPSLRQRMIAIEFDYPDIELEMTILKAETGVTDAVAEKLVALGRAVRAQTDLNLREVASTRTLVATARLIHHGATPRAAARSALIQALTDDRDIQVGLQEIVDSIFG
jgi:nitric oxide reductase NorQ protein